jgi:acetylornithine deacetylase/succinyl-diaminopimelate desuccinylase-like protein
LETVMRLPATTGLLLAAALGAAAEDDTARRLLLEPRVRDALLWIEQREEDTLREQIRLCEIPAPPFHEAERGEAYRRAFERLGLRGVRRDAAGNVLGERPGRSPGPRLVVSAHMDTVFPPGTVVTTTRRGELVQGPGISDNCRGLAVLLAVVAALDRHGIETDGPITFVGTVGEEGLGDLRGVKELFARTLAGRVDRFVSIDGAGLGVTGVAVGSRRYRVTFTASGGHSFGAFGLANPIHALGRAIARIAEIRVPEHPRTTFNVGRVGGGTSVNSIPFEAWFEADLRSSDPASLEALVERFLAAVDQAQADETARSAGRGDLRVRRELVGERPAARLADSVAVLEAVAVSRALGIEASVGEGSTDANVPLHLGIPAVTIGGGGKGRDAHAPAESFDATEAWRGTQRALLLSIALASR